MNLTDELRGATVLAIGGSSGIGLAIARRAHACGATVAIASRSSERLEAARGLIGSDAAVYTLDVSSAEQVDETFAALGPLDHLVSSIPIRVNVISPGIVDTDYWAHLEPGEREAMLRDAASRLPAGRVATADDIATIATALMTSRTITGAVIDVDGGMLLH